MINLHAQFEGQKYLNMETYRKSGQPIRTPVWFVENDGALYVRTPDSTGKFKRIKNNPAVMIAPCDIRGNLKGEWARAEASLASAGESDEAYRLFQKKYGVIYSITRLLLGRKKYVILKIRGIDERK